jgi:hypothetical protein
MAAENGSWAHTNTGTVFVPNVEVRKTGGVDRVVRLRGHKHDLAAFDSRGCCLGWMSPRTFKKFGFKWRKDHRASGLSVYESEAGVVIKGDDRKWYLSVRELGPFDTKGEACAFAEGLFRAGRI